MSEGWSLCTSRAVTADTPRPASIRLKGFWVHLQEEEGAGGGGAPIWRQAGLCDQRLSEASGGAGQIRGRAQPKVRPPVAPCLLFCCYHAVCSTMHYGGCARSVAPCIHVGKCQQHLGSAGCLLRSSNLNTHAQCLCCRDARDSANAAEKRGNMAAFYGNLLTKNVAYAGSRCVGCLSLLVCHCPGCASTCGQFT